MTLALFFSRGVSLKLWLEKGLFDREKLLYEEHLKKGTLKKVFWLTYGQNDKVLADKLKADGKLHKSIMVLSMPKIFKVPKIGSYIYSFFIPFIYKDELKQSDIFKTNQTDGSWSAVIAKKLYKKKLLYRTGFTMSQLENNLKRFNIIIRKSIELIEKLAYKNCNKAIVASKHNLKYVKEKYNIEEEKIQVIYNFIDRNRFYDMSKKREEKIIFIGRLSPEKNILNLIKAISDIDLPLDIYGSGPLEIELKNYVNTNNLNANFKGNVANSELPSLLNEAKYFALVSYHEGMPKALIEGMACGCLCIGTDVTGINEVIIDETTGFLANNTNFKDIEEVIIKAIEKTQKDIEIIKKSTKEHIDNNFTLSSIYEKEKTIIKELLNE
jgi:glycosyltransferase involved in cell wall biosynthesis